MNWRDTVLNEKQVKDTLNKKGYSGSGLVIGELAYQALEAQAETSFSAGVKKAVAVCKAECQARVESIFKEIDSIVTYRHDAPYKTLIDWDAYQALKEKWIK